jgi:hypothetical protein
MRLNKSVILLAICAGSYVPGALGQSGTQRSDIAAQTNTSAQGSTSVDAKKGTAQASSNESTATSAQGQALNSSGSLANGTVINAALSSPVDAKKNKPGDPISAKTTQATKSDGQVVIPKGSKLVGHVTETKEREKGKSESQLGMVFDKAILKGGQEIPLNVAIQALAPAQSVVSARASHKKIAQCWSEEDRASRAVGARSAAERSDLFIYWWWDCQWRGEHGGKHWRREQRGGEFRFRRNGQSTHRDTGSHGWPQRRRTAHVG